MTLTRRRFLNISAAAIAIPVAAKAGESARWQGVALGAPAAMILAGVTPRAARPVFAAIEAELQRLERIFSLYHPGSALVRLNTQGRLDAPPPEMLDLLSLAEAVHHATDGAFDPSVQPLWRARAEGADEATARALTGWNAVRFDAGSVRFDRVGMALTLNGIAQGYVTDRIADLLKSNGFGDVLVDIGEVVARGHRADGAAWQAGIATPGGQLVGRVTLGDRALATSAAMGMVLPDGRGHLISPAGRAPRRALVSVSAPRAAVADGLSTALCLVEDATADRAVARFSGARIEAVA